MNKQTPNGQTGTELPSEWQSVYASLLQERERTQRELAQLRSENTMLRKNLAALLFDDVEIDAEKLLAESVSEPSLEELIAEIEGKVTTK